MTATLTARTLSPVDFIEHHIARGDLSPAARTMDPAEVARQFNEANALEPGDVDYMTLPAMPTAAWAERMATAGREAYMSAEPCAPMRSKVFADFIDTTGAELNEQRTDQAIAAYIRGYRDQMNKITARLLANLEPLN